jgi:DNA-binding CsgD family transcriptional regulator
MSTSILERPSTPPTPAPSAASARHPAAAPAEGAWRDASPGGQRHGPSEGRSKGPGEGPNPGPRIGLVGLPPLLAEGLVAALAAGGGEAASAADGPWQLEVMAGFGSADVYVLQPHDAAETSALQRALPAGAAVVWLGTAQGASPHLATAVGLDGEPGEPGEADQLGKPIARQPQRPSLPHLPQLPRAEAVLDAEVTPRQLRAAIAAVLSGLAVRMPWDAAWPAPAGAPRGPRGEGAADAAETTEPLTTRELEVFELLAKGLSNRDVAAVLGISAHTSKFHVAQILAKVGAATRAEAVAIGLRLGLIGL